MNSGLRRRVAALEVRCGVGDDGDLFNAQHLIALFRELERDGGLTSEEQYRGICRSIDRFGRWPSYEEMVGVLARLDEARAEV